MFDTDKLTRLMTNVSEARTEEKRQAALLVEAERAHKEQQATWKEANEALNVHNKALVAFIDEQTKAAAGIDRMAESDA